MREAFEVKKGPIPPSGSQRADQIGTLAGALDQISEPDAPTLIEMFTALTQERKTTLIAIATSKRILGTELSLPDARAL